MSSILLRAAQCTPRFISAYVSHPDCAAFFFRKFLDPARIFPLIVLDFVLFVQDARRELRGTEEQHSSQPRENTKSPILCPY